ncbi:MAG: hypothetical protein J7L25_06540 [Deltaproteobacteria bacterium]|nr:hypothetical protein [Candidatus Tharpella aukensis]
MSFYFPEQLRSTRYERVYQRLTAVERLMLLREFVGVTYRRRFLFFKNQSIHSRAPGVFRHNLDIAAARQYRRLMISRRVWRHREILSPYLKLIFRHFFYGYLVQGARRVLALERLPSHSPDCYYDFFPNLAAMTWFNRQRPHYYSLIDSLIEQVVADNQRSLYVYALLTASLIKKVLPFAEMGPMAQELFAHHSRPGRTPIGVELEFSNLGRFATFDKPFKGGHSDPLFQNMHYYEAFFLDDVSWRLGGYLDSHIRGRSLLSLPRIGAQPGGFYEYSLVRLDYPRSFSMPLSLDPGLVALYINEVINFVSEIKPHSLHINFEKVAFGELKPQLEDYLCLLLLGGDLGQNEKGAWRERRLADNELRGVIQRRKHRPAEGQTAKEVVEYAFLRLWAPGERDYDYYPVLMAFKGFQYGYNIDLSCRDQVQGMLSWAHNSKALPEAAIIRFIETIEIGWQREGGHPATVCRQAAEEIKRVLNQQNALLKR